MSEEIKELIDTLEDCLKNPNLLDRAKAQRFYNGVSNLQQKVEQLEKENKRLNNIINELEKELREGSFDVYFCSTNTQKTFKSNEIIIKSLILDKLKELKENKQWIMNKQNY